VTGVSSGIGKAVAEALLGDGAIVVGMSRRRAILSSKDAQKNYAHFQGDVSRAADCSRFVKFSFARYHRIDGIIHCAGVGMRSRFLDMDNKLFRRIFETNFFSMVYLFRDVASHLEKSHGFVAVISSVQSEIALPNRSSYGASKRALNGLLESLRIEHPEIHFLTVNAGYVDTNFSQNAIGKNRDNRGERTKKGLAAKDVAQKILAALSKNKEKITPAGYFEKMAFFLSRFAPFLIKKMARKYGKN